MLWKKVGSINDSRLDVIPQLFAKSPHDDVKGSTLVMGSQIFDVLKKESLGLLFLDDSRHVEKERALRFILKPVSAPQCILFGNSSDGKRLTWKSCEQNVMVRDVLRINFRDIAFDWVVRTKIHRISTLCVLVPFASENALPANILKSATDSADACEEIDESERMVAWFNNMQPERNLAQHLNGAFRRLALLGFPSPDCPDVMSKKPANLELSVMLPCGSKVRVKSSFR